MRPARPLLAAVVMTGALLAAAGPAHAVTEACWDDVGTDFDGGGPDVVVGLPSYDLPGKPDAGALAVFSNVAAVGEADPSEPTASLLVTADDIPGLTSQAGARFGASVVLWGDAGDFDDPDDCADLLVGIPGQDIDGKAGAGQVVMLKGTGDGLADVILNLDEATIPGTGGAQAGAGFGSAIAASTLGMIAVGVPGRDIGSAVDAGRVVRLTYPQADITDPDYLVVEQGGDNANTPEAGDQFGEVLEAIPSGQGDILVVGIPHEDIGKEKDAGAVGLLPLPGPLTMVNQNSAGAAGKAEAGDRYGSAVDIYATFIATPVGVVAIGVPGEDNKGGVDAGAVAYASFDIVFDPTEYVGPITGMATTVNQATPGVAGKAEAGDKFGSSIQVGEFGTDNGIRQLVSTAPYENVGSISNAGQLSMTRIEEDGVPMTNHQVGAWTQDSKGVAGKAEAGDRFGALVSSVLLTSLEDDDDSIWEIALVTVPREDVGGVVDAGMAYLGSGDGNHSIALSMPVKQSGAGIGMVPMR